MPQQQQPKRVLFISYAFPPVGGAGVQRTTKFVKYLREFGWEPSVLTVANPSVPAFDESLLADVPPDVTIRRGRTLEPGYALKGMVSAGQGGAQGGGGGESKRRSVKSWAKSTARQVVNVVLQPDPQVLWRPGAMREGKRLLREVPHAAIVASGPPFSSFLIGAALHRKSGVPLVLDYRDEWNLANAYFENRGPGFLSSGIQRRMQHRAVRAASALLATTGQSAAALTAVRDAAQSRATVGWIYNGYDPADFPEVASAPRTGDARYRLAYIGTLWNLTDVTPVVEAVRRLSQAEPDLARDLELVFAGRRTGAQEQVLGQLDGLPCTVTKHPYTDHHSALELLRSADGLCLLLSDVPGAQRVVPAKVFEYMASRKPIFAVAPEGEVWDLVKDYPAAFRLPPRDVDGIVRALAAEIRRCRSGAPAPSLDGWDGARFSRRNQAGELAKVLDSIQSATRSTAA